MSDPKIGDSAMSQEFSVTHKQWIDLQAALAAEKQRADYLTKTAEAAQQNGYRYMAERDEARREVERLKAESAKLEREAYNRGVREVAAALALGIHELTGRKNAD